MAGPDDRLHFAELMAPDVAELIDERRHHDARAALQELMPYEIAEVLCELSEEHRVKAIRLLPRSVAAEVFSYLDYEDQESLVELLGSGQMAAIFDAMDPDDRVNFFEEADQELRDQLLAAMRPEERAATEAILEYPEGSIGRESTPDYLTVKPTWSVSEALEHIRREGREAESLDTLYVVDDAGRLVNLVRLRRLVLADPATKVQDLLRPEQQVIALRAREDREEMVRAFERYDMPVLPVVDDEGRMVGIVTFDDVADVAEEEATEDIQKMGGMEALEEPYYAANIALVVRKRVVWLLFLFIGGLGAVSAMGVFEESIQKYAILALFVPLIIASGGNTGSQAASLMIRALALGDLTVKDWAKVLRRELLSGLMLGSVLGVVGLIVGWIAATFVFDTESAAAGPLHFGFAIGTAIVGVVTVGNLTGSMLPFALKRAGFDEAASSAPFVATIVDVAGLLIYFIVANLIIGAAA